MNAQHHGELVRKIGAAPARYCQYIESARHQSPQGLAALLDLSMAWADVPGMMELGIIDMFLGHLREEKAPTTPRQWKLDADFAHHSLVALGGAERFIDDPRYLSHSRAVANTWPGIFKWCSYIYSARVASESAQDRRMFLDSIVRLFYVLSRFNTFIMAMIRSAGCIELIAKCWALEDIPGQSIILGPIPTTTLGTVVKCAAALGKHDVYERVIRAAGGDANSIVQLLLGRVKKAAKTFNPDLGALGLSWHIDLLVELCQPCPHALRRGFFDAGVIAIVTSAFVALSRTIDQNPTPDSVSLMVSCFKFFSRYLEGDDYPSLVHVVKAGFLAAFLDCSSAFHRMPKESQEAALYIVRRVLPPYLVYRSFIEAVKNATDRLRTPHYQALLAQPVIAEVLRPFITLLAKRTPHVEYMHKLESEEIPAQSEGAPAECDYTKCRRLDIENTFMRCSACHVVSYCSVECQKLAWKSAHRVACKQLKHRPGTDRPFLYSLSQSEGDINFAIFHDLAEKQFPDVPHADLMPCIDFRTVPEKYSVKVIKPGASGHPGVVHSPTSAATCEARFQALVAKLRGSGTTIIQSIISSGATIEILWTLMERKHFWEDKNTYSGSGEEEAPDSGTEDEESEEESKVGVTANASTLADLD